MLSAAIWTFTRHDDWMALFRRKTRPPNDATYLGLRSMALQAVEHGLALPPASHPDVSGVLVDIPAKGGFATLVALTDNTTSLYTSAGGGTIGAGQHASVAIATHNLLSQAQLHMEMISGEEDGELPPPQMVRIHLLGPSGTRAIDVPEDSYWGRVPNALTPVIAAAQRVMTALREASPS